MKIALTIALCLLTLTACKNPNGPQRWSGSPNIAPMGFNNGTPQLSQPVLNPR